MNKYSFGLLLVVFISSQNLKAQTASRSTSIQFNPICGNSTIEWTWRSHGILEEILELLESILPDWVCTGNLILHFIRALVFFQNDVLFIEGTGK